MSNKRKVKRSKKSRESNVLGFCFPTPVVLNTRPVFVLPNIPHAIVPEVLYEEDGMVVVEGFKTCGKVNHEDRGVVVAKFIEILKGYARVNTELWEPTNAGMMELEVHDAVA